MQRNIHVATHKIINYIRSQDMNSHSAGAEGPRPYVKDLKDMTQSTKKAAAAAAEKVETATADLREMTERGMDQAKAAYDQFKGSAQEAVELLDGSATALKTGGTEFNLKAIEFAQSNLNAGFDFARQVAAVKDVNEFVELQSTFARDRFAAYTQQARDLGELSVKVAEGASKPLAEGVKKSFEQAKQVFPQV